MANRAPSIPTQTQIICSCSLQFFLITVFRTEEHFEMYRQPTEDKLLKKC